jgi:F0F1-type ATP synthase assembly protein I
VNRIYPKKVNKSTEGKSGKTLETLSEAYRKLAPYLNIGTTWAISVLFFTWLGWYFDNKWETNPLLTVVGAFIGISTGFYHFIKVVAQESKKDKNNKSNI